jgi:hypothetical protein
MFLDEMVHYNVEKEFRRRMLLEALDKEFISKTEHEFYDVVKEKWNPGTDPKDEMEMISAYAKDGTYIGDPKFAKMLVDKYGINTFEKADPTDSVASIGFSPDQKKWYGWSHRGLYGFEIGDEVKEGDCTATSGSTDPSQDKSLPVGFKAKTLEDFQMVLWLEIKLG